MIRFRIAALLFIVATMVGLPGNRAYSFDEKQAGVLRESVREWNRMRRENPRQPVDLSGIRLNGKNLRGADLANADLRGADLGGSDLSDADLRGAMLDSTSLRKTLFYDADLRGASLRGASMEHAGMAGADLREALLDGAVFMRADLSGCLLRGALLRGVDFRAADLRAADLAGADLDGAYLWRADLDGANLSGAKVTAITVLETGKKASPGWAGEHGALFVKQSEARVVEKKEQKKDLPAGSSGAAISTDWPDNPVQQKIRFGVTRQQAPRLTYDVHQHEMLTDNLKAWNRMRKAQPEAPVRLSGSKLNRKMLDGANLRNADMSGAQLKGADLVNADLRGANLSGANLREADLTKADLRGADLRGAYLWRANLSWTETGGVIVDSRTVLETGRNATPEWADKHGALYRGQVPAMQQ